MHLGAFLPWYRNHYNGYTKSFQEPFRYGEQVPTNCRKYIELRYRMLQIFYDAMFEWTQTGMPMPGRCFSTIRSTPASTITWTTNFSSAAMFWSRRFCSR